MNNEQFRRLIAANAAKPQTTDNNGASLTPSRGGALGSRQKSSIPMTPRSVVGLHKSDFARQLAEQNQHQQKEKKFRSFAPKGSKLAEGYVDRTQARQFEEEDERATKLKTLEEALNKEEIDEQTFDTLRSQIAGGDLSSTHLVKGLDFKLLERIRKGENVYSDGEARDEEQEIPENVDDELDRLQEEEVAAIAKEKTIKKGRLSTAPTNFSRKRTRDQILAEMKAARDAAKAKEEPTLGNKFKKIGGVKIPGTRIERDSRGREVMLIVDEDGNEKRKVRKTAPDDPSQKESDLMVPDPNIKPLGMEVPDVYKSKAKEPKESDNIFDDVDDDYDPLAGLDDDSDDSEKEREDEASTEQAKATNSDQEAKDVMPPPPRPVDPSEPRNYFKNSKTSLVSSEKLEAPSMSDPAIQAALKKAASLRANTSSSEEVDDEEARAKAERRRKMLENNDRDAEDMDMGFGTSRFEDDADLDEQRVKLSQWGQEDEGGNHGKGSGSKRKRGPKKRKGDGNNAADVLREMERQRGAK
ncbi:hypothetical protein ANO14919_077160 [Xylariales sp. No.14919]|nr:hypothetical protein ANO14919_077160 [Xylariales sp. No.14919]